MSAELGSISRAVIPAQAGIHFLALGFRVAGCHYWLVQQWISWSNLFFSSPLRGEDTGEGDECQYPRSKIL